MNLFFEPSSHQKQVFDFVKNEKGSAIIEAVAGSGKTTTILEALKFIEFDEHATFLAFNKNIAEEIKERAPATIEVLTLNALGHRSWRNWLGRNPRVNAKKTYDILWGEEIERKFHTDYIREFSSQLGRLVGIAKANGIVPGDRMKVRGQDCEGIKPDTMKQWEHLAFHYDVDFESEHWFKTGVNVAREVLKLSLNQLDEIDFDDQLYLPVIFGARVNRSDVVFVDEAQDVSNIQRILVEKASRGGRVIAVGDSHQAIYGFRGADSSSLINIGKTFNAKTLPLSVCYRCPRQVVQLAQNIVPQIEARPDAPEGIVKSLGVYQAKHFKLYDMVICRNSKPLVQLAYFLIQNDMPITLKGKDLSRPLLTLIKQQKQKTVDGLMKKLREWLRAKVERCTQKNQDPTQYFEKLEIIETILDCCEVETIDDLKREIQRLFNQKPEDCVTLSTVHGAKGLEADRVLFLDADLIPSKYAKQPWQKSQEENLYYVAVTRAKKELYFVNSPKKEF